MCNLISRCYYNKDHDYPELRDEKTLEFCGISEGTILFLSDIITVFVKTLFGKVVACDVPPNWDFLRLKRLIEEKEGIPPSTPPVLMSLLHLISILVDYQQFIDCGEKLVETRTLSSYRIQKNSTIGMNDKGDRSISYPLDI